MVSMQFLTPLLERYGHTAAPIISRSQPYLAPFPGSLAGIAVADAAKHSFGGALAAVAGLLAYVVALSALLWQRFAAQYRGEELSETSSPVHRAVARTGPHSERADGLRFLPAQVAEMLRKEFRYLLRNGFSFVLLVLPPMMILIFTMQSGGRHRHSVSTMGFSRSAYFMSPVRFREVFLGKNLMLACVIAVEITLSIVVFSFRVGLPGTPVVIATLVAIVFTVAGQFAIANWSSLTFPRRLNFGQMRGQRQSGMAVLVAFGAQIMLGGISALLFFVGRWTGNAWLPTEAFVFLAAAAIGGYVASLNPVSDYAEKKKETLIEALCR
jgi:hypothetical protein